MEAHSLKDRTIRSLSIVRLGNQTAIENHKVFIALGIVFKDFGTVVFVAIIIHFQANVGFAACMANRSEFAAYNTVATHVIDTATSCIFIVCTYCLIPEDKVRIYRVCGSFCHVNITCKYICYSSVGQRRSGVCPQRICIEVLTCGNVHTLCNAHNRLITIVLHQNHMAFCHAVFFNS